MQFTEIMQLQSDSSTFMSEVVLLHTFETKVKHAKSLFPTKKLKNAVERIQNVKNRIFPWKIKKNDSNVYGTPMIARQSKIFEYRSNDNYSRVHPVRVQK